MGAFFVLPLALSACGGDGGVPGNAVVKIGPDTIKTTAFDHWFKIAATSQAQQGGATAAVTLPDPPSYAKCIAQKKKTAAKPAKGQPNPTDATYKAQCEQEYTTLRDQVMQFLISSAWIEGESADRGVKISDTDVKKDFDKQRQQSFPKDKDYEAFLKSSGYVQEDLLYRVKVQDLSNKLRTKILEGTDKVSPAQISNYYNKNKSKFAVPEKRDIRIVLTKTEGQAKKAKAALASGQSWKQVASKYSIDQGTRDTGGLMSGVAKGQQEKALDTATFSAKKGAVGGPIKSQFGYYVFEVEKITPGTQQSEKESSASIKQLLVSQQQQTKLDAFVKDFQKKWKGRTECAKSYATTDCKNAPKPKASTAAPSNTATTGTPTTGADSSGGSTTDK
ncbi:MAG TPA: peptidyl-prolyl cis-trans isomerase [Baekduia sp.]|uniref:peptidyl-prolyl cis-trans isomerase n=1 Tax=Baekduia sp. TaxID=2600305 RepID=UPI002D794522|nr:peptidyl-prolyl cis-trans isomerase [Baekduia sp.]HET6510526.1 peptidyl-prolyl cis-trans isomerase [Baekduia sp.]